MINLPFKLYYPSWEPTDESSLPKSENILLKEAKELLIAEKSRVALVLVDVWGKGDESDLVNACPITKRISDFLIQCRLNEITIIHSPNFPIVNKYKQYHKLRAIVENDFQSIERKLPEYMSWPDAENSLYRKYMNLRNKYEQHGNNFNYQINKCVEPLDSEYIAQSFEEFRYILWKEKTDIIMFVGGGLRQCLLHRPIGINALRGVGGNNNGLYSHYYNVKNFVCVLQDCLYCIGSDDISSDRAKTVMLETLGSNMTFIANSRDITFN